MGRTMNDQSEYPMQVGDTVSYDGYAPDVIGVVIEKIDRDYVRVRWTDMTCATTHRQTALHRTPIG